MLTIPLWRRIFIWGVVALGLILALPNGFYTRVEQSNDARAEILVQGATPEREAAAAGWPDWLPSGLVNLGLDLRGGAHLLAEVQVEDVYTTRMDATWPELRSALAAVRDEIGAFRRIDEGGGALIVRLSDPAAMPRALEVARGLARPVQSLTGVGATDLVASGDGAELTLRLSDEEQRATDDRTIQQSLEIIRRRVDEVGTREPTIQRQGADRVLIQVPGIGSAEELKTLIGTTAQLTFHPVQGRTTEQQAATGRVLSYPSIDEPGTFYTLERTPVVAGEDLVDAQPSFDQNGRPAVTFRFNPTGARKFGDYTAENIGSPLCHRSG